MTDATPSLEERLERVLGVPLTASQLAVLDARMAGALSAPTPRHRRVARRSLLLVALLMLLVPTVFGVGAAIFSTEAPYGMGNAASYEAELQAAKTVTPLPAGATWPPYLDQAPDRGATYGVGLGREMVEMNAYCLWLGDWYRAQDTGDTAEAAVAARALDHARSWATFTDRLTSDQGFRDAIAGTINAVQQGDAPIVLRQLELNCTGTWATGR